MNLNLREKIMNHEEFQRFVIEEENIVNFLNGFERGEYYKKDFINDSNAMKKMLKYIENLTKEGLNIGHGEAEFGYKMPIRNMEMTYRPLIIFRRNKKLKQIY